MALRQKILVCEWNSAHKPFVSVDLTASRVPKGFEADGQSLGGWLDSE